MFVICCAILWFYWNRFKKPKEKIFISADCWLCVFDLLTPSQLGLGIALISHRFDFYVDEHFKTRKWTLGNIQINNKIGENGQKKMEITNCRWKSMQIPQKPLPKKVVGFEDIMIRHINNSAIAFLHHFRQLFTKCQINLAMRTNSDRTLEFILRNIWPMIGKNIHGLELPVGIFHRLRQFTPSILNECPSLRIVKLYGFDGFFTEFPADDSAMASDRKAVAKWVFTPRPDNVPKVLKCSLLMDMGDGILSPSIEALKTAFFNASSPVNFIVIVYSFDDSVVPFDLINEWTREQLTLKRINFSNCFLFVRSPIARDESKWTKWEEEAIGWDCFYQWNQIDIRIDEGEIEDGLLAETPGPSDLQQK